MNLLIKEGHEVEVWDNLSTGKLERVNDKAIFRKIDINIDEMPATWADTIFHLAAPTSVQESLENPYKYEQGCYMTTKRMLDWGLQNGVQNFVLASTAAIYGEPVEVPVSEDTEINPMSPYAEQKRNSEILMSAYHRNFGIKCTALRLFNVFGEGQPDSGSYAPAVGLFLKQFESFQPITVTGTGLQTRDYIYVKDIAKAFLAAGLNNSLEFRIFNVGSGEETSVLEIAEAFGGEIKFIAARKEPMRSCANISDIKKELNWNPSETIFNYINKIK